MKINELYIKTKLKIFNTFRKVFLGKIIGNTPSNIIRSIEESLYMANIENIICEVKELLPPSIINYKFPNNYPLFFCRNKTFEKRNCYKLTEVFTSPNSGIIWTKDNLILQESVGSINRIMEWGRVLSELSGKPKYLLNDGNYTVFSSGGGYYHWLLESLPNLLYTLHQYEDVKVIIANNSPIYMLDALKILFGNNYDQRVIVLDNTIYSKYLCFTQYHAYSGFICNNDIEIVKHCIKDKYLRDISNKNNKKRIYISRRKASERRLANEIELEKELKKIGFTIVFNEDMNLVDQIRLFSNVKIVVSPHGAGLSNIIWSNGFIKVLEIFPSNFVNDCYARLAVQLGNIYDYDICSRFTGYNYKININSVLKKLDNYL